MPKDKNIFFKIPPIDLGTISEVDTAQIVDEFNKELKKKKSDKKK